MAQQLVVMLVVSPKWHFSSGKAWSVCRGPSAGDERVPPDLPQCSWDWRLALMIINDPAALPSMQFRYHSSEAAY